MLDIKNNSNSVLKAFQNFLGNRESEDFLNQIGIWIFGYVTRRLRASEDEASLVFLKFWIEKKNLIHYFNSKGCKNIFGFLSFFSKNLLRSIRKSLETSKTIDEFILSNEISKQKQSSCTSYNNSQKFLRYAINRLSILNRIILCLRYGITLTNQEKEFLYEFLRNKEKCENLLSEFERRLQKQKSRDLERMEKLNFYHWKISSQTETNSNFYWKRKRKLQAEIMKVSEIFTLKELSTYLGISKYKVAQSCEYSIQYIIQSMELKNKNQNLFLEN
ncbi:MAG: hypothetical protein N3A69_07380 [Leptospiraceae bacterium]|nr:hypothetical protein [Leptospiraceae bacterium]